MELLVKVTNFFGSCHQTRTYMKIDIKNYKKWKKRYEKMVI